jgi:hypothetical protein
MYELEDAENAAFELGYNMHNVPTENPISKASEYLWKATPRLNEIANETSASSWDYLIDEPFADGGIDMIIPAFEAGVVQKNRDMLKGMRNGY